MICSVADILPTLAEAVAAWPMPQTQGDSLMPALRDPDDRRQRLVVWNSPESPNFYTARVGQWKAIFSAETELFDLAGDPTERKNVASAHGDIVNKLKQAATRIRGAKDDSAENEKAEL